MSKRPIMEQPTSDKMFYETPFKTLYETPFNSPCDTSFKKPYIEAPVKKSYDELSLKSAYDETPCLTTIDSTIPPNPLLSTAHMTAIADLSRRNHRVAPIDMRPPVHPRGLCKACKRGFMRPKFTVITLCACLSCGPQMIPCFLQDKCRECGKTGDLYCCCFC